MSFYQFLVLVHIFSAIIGLGPGFLMTFIAKQASTLTELRHSYFIRNRMHIFVMVGGTLLLVTGLIMGMLNPLLFKQGWYIVSLSLYMVGLAFGPFVLKPFSKPIKELLNEDYEYDEIPEAYHMLAKRLFFYEDIINIIFIFIIALMILKPF